MLSRQPVTCCFIVRNDPHLPKAIASIAPHVSEIVVVWTDGVTKDELERIDRLCRDLGCHLNGGTTDEHNDETGALSDFAAARNYAYSLATQPWVMWLDSDDLFEGRLPELNHIAGPNVRFIAPYEYSFDRNGHCTCVHPRERITRRADAWEWREPVHEGLFLVEGEPMDFHTDIFKVVHQRRGNQDAMLRNYRIMRSMFERGDVKTARQWFNYGVSSIHAKQHAAGREALAKAHELSDWEDEKEIAFCRILESMMGEIEGEKGGESRLPHDPLDEVSRSSSCLRPMLAAFLCEYYARCLNGVDQHKDPEEFERLNARVLIAGRNALGGIKSGDRNHLWHDPSRFELNVPWFMHAALLRSGRIAESTAMLEPVLRARPDDGPLHVMYWTARSQLEQWDPCGGALVYDIVFACMPTNEAWDWDSPDTKGIGGSETAVIAMARQLAKRGLRVAVYGGLSREGIDQRVTYRRIERIGEVHKASVLVAWRSAMMLELCPAQQRWLWVHDILPPDVTPYRAHLADRVLALSPWHARRLIAEGFSPRKVCITSNGIDPRRFARRALERDPLAAIYSSSPDRGLDRLLDCWPDIVEKVQFIVGKKPTLTVFYGDHAIPEEKSVPLRAKMAELGVHWAGRVSQTKLAEAMLSSGVWLYPTHFSETSCCHPDTRVSIPGDHRGGAPTVKIADLVGKSGFPVYAFNEAEHRFQLATCKRVWQTKIAQELVELELDSGERLRLTPDHLVLTYDGDWVEAGTLGAGASLRALHYRYNVAIRDADGSWTNEHRLVGEWKKGDRLSADEVVDHQDLLRLDNRPEALTVMTAREHGSKTHKGAQRSRRSDALRVAGWHRWAATPEGKERIENSGVRLGKTLWEKVAAMAPAERQSWEAMRTARRTATIRAREEADPAFAARRLEERREAQRKSTETRFGKNHKVVAVRRIEGGPVFDMEVEGLHNFVADGVVIHNCISRSEAIAAGMHAVYTDVAALGDIDQARWPLGVPECLSDDGTCWNRAGFIEAAVEAFCSAPKNYLPPKTWNDIAVEWLRDDPKLRADLPLVVSVGADSPPVVNIYLAEHASGGLIWAHDSADTIEHGGGCRDGFLGLVRALAKAGRYRVRALSTWQKPWEYSEGVEWVSLAEAGRLPMPDVALAYYDTSPLVGLYGCLRIASHHTYEPYQHFAWADVHTAPSKHSLEHLRKRNAPNAPWYVLPNGVRDEAIERRPVPGRVIYHTSPDRGLDHLAHAWAHIRKEVPDATLHIVGNVQGMLNASVVHDSLKTKFAARIANLRTGMAAAEAAGGVTYLGRLSRAKLRYELAEASCFAYPADPAAPSETFSVSIMECCKAGIPVVTLATDSLEEIYGTSQVVMNRPFDAVNFATAVSAVLLHPHVAESLSTAGRLLADRFTFEREAEVLSQIIDKHLQ